MIAYQKEKIESAVCFFASKHKEYTGRNLYQTFLYKYLGLFESEYIKKYGHPPLGLKYLAMDKGPVPQKFMAKGIPIKVPVHISKRPM